MESDANDFGTKSFKTIEDCDGFLYKLTFIFAGDITVKTGSSPWVNFMLLDDVHTLVKKVYGVYVDNGSFDYDDVNVKSIYGKDMTLKVLKRTLI